ncbi:hypothetical protein SS50377_26972 [Spironucleus salmonicida]|uniref:Uncharacterized protein n=1 Tax=Spironucleus salmonicida TaxID=348837 RepID=V6M2K2_9EUKA|nr:hypothetical protein SS50377_26972 [Spironucleus salmonicida]|eukprot:EST47484.1 Hypothetical protein SS50377_12468 [Spironucleus salmonicida]
MSQDIEKLETELAKVKRSIDSGKGDFMKLMDMQKQLTDQIRSLKLMAAADVMPSGPASSQAICCDDTDEQDDEANNESFDVDM